MNPRRRRRASKRDRVIAGVLVEEGIRHPHLAIRVARDVNLPISDAASLLRGETGGGHPVWGHDPVACGPVGGTVTRENYAAYKARRGSCGMQGCADTQLTWYSYQDEADVLGGCWRPGPNRHVGFGLLAGLIRANGRREGWRAYNGSGAYAVAYSAARRADARRIRGRIRRRLRRHGLL